MAAASPFAAALARVPVRERELEVLGSATRYWDYGPEDAATTIVTFHGYRGDHHGLEPVVAELAEFRIVSPDLPGFGASSPMPDSAHTIADYARWADAFLEAIGLRGTAVILGHSFGSIITSHAIAAGTPAPRLVLVNAITDPPEAGPGKFPTWITYQWYKVGRALPPALGRAWLANPATVRLMSVNLAKTRDSALRRWIHEEHDRYFSEFSDPLTVTEAFEASMSATVTDVADALTMPVLLIAGAEDIMARPEGQRRLAARLPHATLDVLEGVGHLIHYERPADAAKAIREFLAAP